MLKAKQLYDRANAVLTEKAPCYMYLHVWVYVMTAGMVTFCWSFAVLQHYHNYAFTG